MLGLCYARARIKWTEQLNFGHPKISRDCPHGNTGSSCSKQF